MPKTVIIPCALLLAAMVMVGFIVGASAFGMKHDDGVYLVTAKALAEGKGYRIISLPAEMVQTKYPILLPLLLSAVWRISPQFPENALLLKAVPVAAMIGWLVLCYWFFRRYGDVPRHAALWLVFFLAVSESALYAFGLVMSDSVFALLLLAAIAVLVRADQQPTFAISAAAGLLTAATYYSRTAGLPLVAAGALAFITRRRFKQAAVFCAAALPFVIAWSVWQRQAIDLGSHLENYYSARGYADDLLFGNGYSVAAALYIFGKNIYLLFVYPADGLFRIPVPFSVRHMLPLLGIPFWVLVARGWMKAPAWLRPVKFLIILYVLMLLLYVWPPDRYLLPILPLLFLFAYTGLPERTPQWVMPALAIMPIVFASYTAKTSLKYHVLGTELPWQDTGNSVVNWPRVAQVQDWIRDRTAPDAVVLTNFDPAMYLYSSRKAVRPYGVAGADIFYGIRGDLQKKIRECLDVISKYHARYLVETGHDDLEEPSYPQLLGYLISTGRLRLVQQFAPHYRVFEIVPSGEGAALRAGAESKGDNGSWR